MPQNARPLHEPGGGSGRIILIRHGKPALPTELRTGHHGFRRYIDDYEASGLDPESLPPAEIRDLVAELGVLFTSGRKRAHESARALGGKAEIVADALFDEAPLASPRIPLLRMNVPKWAVVARILWHAGYHPEIENPKAARARAKNAADILMARARDDGAVALIAHGYFNFLIGRELTRHGFHQTGTHRAKYWNAVVYKGA
jgi:broad specificity phosphatase PhoE